MLLLVVLVVMEFIVRALEGSSLFVNLARDPQDAVAGRMLPTGGDAAVGVVALAAGCSIG